MAQAAVLTNQARKEGKSWWPVLHFQWPSPQNQLQGAFGSLSNWQPVLEGAISGGEGGAGLNSECVLRITSEGRAINRGHSEATAAGQIHMM